MKYKNKLFLLTFKINPYYVQYLLLLEHIKEVKKEFKNQKEEKREFLI